MMNYLVKICLWAFRGIYFYVSVLLFLRDMQITRRNIDHDCFNQGQLGVLAVLFEYIDGLSLEEMVQWRRNGYKLKND